MRQRVTDSYIFDIVARYLHPDLPYRGIVLALAMLLICLVLYERSCKWLNRYLDENAFKEENSRAFMHVYGLTWKTIIGILVLIAASGSFALLGLTVGFIGTMLGWSLQAPIRGIAAWVMVVVKKPFRIGDRITVAGVTGDVTEIQLNHIILNQVGGSVVGEELSGRGILVPNAMLFGENVINYNLFQGGATKLSGAGKSFMLDEVPVRITFDSDFDFAKELCLKAARQAVHELIGEVDEEPFIRCEFLQSGVMIRVRYKTRPNKRQEVSSRVTELIWEAINRERPRVKFRYPVNVTGLVPDSGKPSSMPWFGRKGMQ